MDSFADFDELINKDAYTLIDFSATWCMPCRMMKPILEHVVEVETDIDIYNVDIDDNEDIAKRYRVFSVPTLMMFKSGEPIDSLVGLNSFEEVVAFIEKCKKEN